MKGWEGWRTVVKGFPSRLDSEILRALFLEQAGVKIACDGGLIYSANVHWVLALCRVRAVNMEVRRAPVDQIQLF